MTGVLEVWMGAVVMEGASHDGVPEVWMGAVVMEGASHDGGA